jgi:hypothetical protein
MVMVGLVQTLIFLVIITIILLTFFVVMTMAKLVQVVASIIGKADAKLVHLLASLIAMVMVKLAKAMDVKVDVGVFFCCGVLFERG